ncbi:hypothetical protein [Stenotrophomonas rhizophila]|jgi:nucleoside 2-deoxyribosyltransferase|uniref:hypothetical protein n=1 Tax=Stenotrophomonas rhizophila TaxID=216778 RepID=UPI0028A78B88|nr:hypothetical protein [Stenotrophomonas rhizophila]
MSFSATVYRVLIASPSDVQEERSSIQSAIHDWNSQHSVATRVVLLPVMWETHAAPMMGRPQEVINTQLVRSCDMLIGALWTRLGSPTGVADSGTVEEINWFVEKSKPVMLYFSKKPLPADCDLAQVQKVRDFKKSLSSNALLMDYDDASQLHAAILRQLSTVVDNMSVSPTVDVEELRKADKKVVAKTARRENAQLRAKTIPSDFILADYTEKSFVVLGPVKTRLAELQALNGKWTRARDGRTVLMFSKRHLQAVADLLGVKGNLVDYDATE